MEVDITGHLANEDKGGKQISIIAFAVHHHKTLRKISEALVSVFSSKLVSPVIIR